jgi:predicted DCC family thiol-disulfide oxidoreductase YuxK
VGAGQPRGGGFTNAGRHGALPLDPGARVQLIGPGGETWQGSAAIEQLLNILPRGRLIAWVFHLPFVRVLADRFYRWFAKNRYHLGCGDHCQSRPLNVIFDEGDAAQRRAGG